MYKAQALLGFSGYGITASNGEILEIDSREKLNDLERIGFVKPITNAEAEQIKSDRTEARMKAESEAKMNAEEVAKARAEAEAKAEEEGKAQAKTNARAQAKAQKEQ